MYVKKTHQNCEKGGVVVRKPKKKRTKRNEHTLHTPSTKNRSDLKKCY